MNKYILWTLFILGNLFHIVFLKLNEVLKIADSFAYLQMAHKLKDLSVDGFGNGWFGFLYSIPIAIANFAIHNEMLAAFVINILLFNLLVVLCYIIGRNNLTHKYNTLFLVLIFISPILLNYNIHILSENLYIPLFLILFIGVLRYRDVPDFGGSVFLGLILALLYYTRAEAFIYLGSLGLVILYLLAKKEINFGKAFLNYSTIIISFLIFILPYLFYMHSFTGEWGLTNKGSSNLRQAQLRGISKMDDDGFEQAVGELTSDNHHLIAGFAGGLKYDTPQEGESFKNYILENPSKVLERMKENQVKLYTNNLPKLILGDAQTLYKIEGNNIFYKNKLFLILLIIPIFFMIYGMIKLIQRSEGYTVYAFFTFFSIASIFFTLFFVLDRYFVIFVPIFIFFTVYGIQEAGDDLTKMKEHLKFIFASLLLTGLFSLGTLSYYNTFVGEDAKYEVKKEAGERLKQNDFRTNLRVKERFPVVTYYAGSWERWITPYTDKLENLVEYAKFNEINYLVVDSIDFKKYRPDLVYLLEEPNKKYAGLDKIKTFEKNGQKVILYRIK